MVKELRSCYVWTAVFTPTMPSNGSDPRQLMTSVLARVFFRAEGPNKRSEPVFLEQNLFDKLDSVDRGWRHTGDTMSSAGDGLAPAGPQPEGREERWRFAAPDSVQKHDAFIFIPVSQSALTLEMFYIPLYSANVSFGIQHI